MPFCAGVWVFFLACGGMHFMALAVRFLHSDRSSRFLFELSYEILNYEF